MSKSFRKDLTGKRFGRLKVLEFVPTEDNHSHWLCECDCGNRTIVDMPHLTTGHTLSCGCRKKEVTNNIKSLNYSHGLHESRLYSIWTNMKARCYNHNSRAYKNYGGRGISICDEWKDDFKAFYSWAMSNGYRDDLTIDRIDVNGNYTPSNCRWADRQAQMRNTRTTIMVDYNGEEMPLRKVAEISGISYATLYYRFINGKKGEQLFRPVK